MIIATKYSVLVRIVKQPTGTVDGIALKRYHVGQTYEVAPFLADYLVLQGFAISEMRHEKRSKRKRPTDRRRMN
jgi:hypothetical protein